MYYVIIPPLSPKTHPLHSRFCPHTPHKLFLCKSLVTKKPNGHFPLVGWPTIPVRLGLGDFLENGSFSAKTSKVLGQWGQLIALFLSSYLSQLFRSNWQKWSFPFSWMTFFFCPLGHHPPLVSLPLGPSCICLTSASQRSPGPPSSVLFSRFPLSRL